MSPHTDLSGLNGGESRSDRSDRWDGRVAALAGRQFGVVSRRQLRGLGLGASAIESRLRRGYLLPLHRGVYAVGHLAITWETRMLAAVLASGRGAVLSHRSAGHLWRIVPRSAIAVEVTRPGQFRPRRGIKAHQARLRPDEVDARDGIPVTSLFRTMFDLAAVLDVRQLERAWNELKVRGHTDRVSMPEMLARHKGKRGTVTLRRLLESSRPEGITRNEFEEAFAALLDANAIPRPRLNATLFLRNRFYEIDCLWERQRLALELDGREVHATPKAFESDRQRDRVLLAEGYRTSRVTWRQLHNEPTQVVADLRDALSLP